MITFEAKYVKVWNIDMDGKYPKLRISTSEKDKEGNYINSNWFATCIGKSAETARKLKEGDTIAVRGKISNKYDKEKNVTYYNVALFDIELVRSQQSSEEFDDECPI